MLYAQTNVKEKLAELRDPRFANLYLGKSLIGTICFLPRQVCNKAVDQKVFYVRYFTFLEKFRSSGTTKRKGKSNTLREEVQRLMNGEGLEAQEEPMLFAYVDKENIRSRRLIDEFGFRKAGSFRTVLFTRFFPKSHKNVRQIKLDEWDGILALLRDYYHDYSLVSLNNLKKANSYFVIEENDAPVCGGQANPDRWRILSLLGFSGKMMMALIPKIPILRRLFNANYRFVFLEYTFCRTGYEKHLSKLFESILASYNLNSAILCLDPTAQLYEQVHKIPLGFSHGVMGEKEIEIVIKSSDFLLPTPPFYVSGPDVL